MENKMKIRFKKELYPLKVNNRINIVIDVCLKITWELMLRLKITWELILRIDKTRLTVC